MAITCPVRYVQAVFSAVLAPTLFITGAGLLCAALLVAVLTGAIGVLRSTVDYYRYLLFFSMGGAYSKCSYTGGRRAKIQVFSLVLIFRLWNRPHYRNGTFQDDMIKNLRNVAIPGTGFPLHLLCFSRLTAGAFIAVWYPLVALVAAANAARGKGATALSVAYRAQLLTPDDWFSYWRLNCRLATYHAGVTGVDDYGCEDKLRFLQEADRLGVAVSPFLKLPGLVVKHRNEEGGMGYHSFTNAVAGGDWIIQETLGNSPALAKLLPKVAPLSTFRVITASKGGIEGAAPEATSLSCVWRAGREGAATDHSSILFDVGRDGVFKRGTTNAHWYELGPGKAARTPWTSSHSYTDHPDTGRPVTGEHLAAPSVQDILDFAATAHATMIPRVPLSGWDVALTDNPAAPMCMLECNLSCNFFRGKFDKALYFKFVEDYLLFLERAEAGGGGGSTHYSKAK